MIQFNTFTEVIEYSPVLKDVFINTGTREICNSIGRKYDERVEEPEYESYNSEPQSIMFFSPFVFEPNYGVRSVIYCIRFVFTRKNLYSEKVENILNAMVVVKDNEYVEIDSYLPGTTLVDLELFKDINERMYEAGLFSLEKNYQLNKNEIAVEIKYTELIEHDDNKGWTEVWNFIDLVTKKESKVKIKFFYTSKGVIYDIFV